MNLSPGQKMNKRLIAIWNRLFPKNDIARRGQLIKFRCSFDGKVRCSWDAIYHGSGIVHSIGKRRCGTWQMSSQVPEDRITKINHGILIERILT